jgi:glycosyltransferase involved in cell wall biosynthesis
VSDFDDDLFDIDPQNPAYNTFGTEECWFEHKDDPTDKKYLRKDGEDGFDIKRNQELLEGTSKALIISDLITVSTEPLRKSFLPLNENIVVLENAIQPIEMTGSSNPNKRDFFEQTVIGWQGSDSHVHDMRVVAPVLKRVQQRYGDMVKYRFFGTRFEQLYEGLDFEVIPWIKPHLFYDRFSHNLFDIGIIPLENTRFNRCKSNIKFLEYSYYGIPSVVADVTPYKETVKHNVTGLKYRDPEQMFQNICKLVEDRLLRKKLAETAKKHVIANYNVNQKAIQWKRVYEQALKDKKLALGLS